MKEVEAYNNQTEGNLLKLMGDTGPADFEEMYHAVRQKENRIYHDWQVALLPDITASHVHAGEWKVRKQSSGRLTDYLKRKQRPLNILDVGCGNGWLSAAMAAIPDTLVTGWDIHATELHQARRVFDRKNVRFVYKEFGAAQPADPKFDVIVFAASIQYFPSMKKVIKDALSLLTPKGEIHIIDTHLYHSEELDAARERTRAYYHSLGFPEMADHYFHHQLKDLKAFNYKVLYNPKSIRNKLLNQYSPFYWILIS